MKNEIKKSTPFLGNLHPDGDLSLWKRLDNLDKNPELCSSVLFVDFAIKFITDYEEKVDKAVELHGELSAIIEFGINDVLADYHNFINPYTDFIQLVLELEASKPILINFAKVLGENNLFTDEEKSNIYPCSRKNFESHIEYVLSSVDDILGSDTFLHFAQEYNFS